MDYRKNRINKRSLTRFTPRFTNKHPTSHAGLSLMNRFWDQLGGEECINNELGELKAHNEIYPVSRIITLLIMGIIRGAKHISHISLLGHDQGLRKLWDWVRFPVETTIIRTMNLFGQAQVIRLVNLTIPHTW
ncbi:MAG: hypothetical protein P9X24_10900 [Candidatus Hatepunaea meridiana]|nr:hypothetical protein [Candidatus Hatepunaea meridiana]